MYGQIDTSVPGTANYGGVGGSNLRDLIALAMMRQQTAQQPDFATGLTGSGQSGAPIYMLPTGNMAAGNGFAGGIIPQGALGGANYPQFANYGAPSPSGDFNPNSLPADPSDPASETGFGVGLTGAPASPAAVGYVSDNQGGLADVVGNPGSPAGFSQSGFTGSPASPATAGLIAVDPSTGMLPGGFLSDTDTYSGFTGFNNPGPGYTTAFGFGEQQGTPSPSPSPSPAPSPSPSPAPSPSPSPAPSPSPSPSPASPSDFGAPGYGGFTGPGYDASSTDVNAGFGTGYGNNADNYGGDIAGGMGVGFGLGSDPGFGGFNDPGPSGLTGDVGLASADVGLGIDAGEGDSGDGSGGSGDGGAGK